MAVPISNVTRRTVYAPSGSGGAGPYSFTFEILANTDIAVYKDDTLLTLTTHYTVTINSNGTGSVTITAAGLALSPTSPTQYAVVGNRTIQRTTDFTTGGDFFANTINDELDQQTIFAQQNAEGLARALSAPQTDPTSINMTLPAKASRALKTLSFDVNGNPTPGVSASDVANAVTYATNAANSATAAASSASAASSSASAASSSASTASTQASNASTSASNASTSASGASTSATAAAGSASTASTQASNASTSATNAASSASAASTSAANAATSATNASNSASTATTQASNAATSASSASTSATSAANSAAAAASALDSFDDRYLGTKSSDPTLDNDGNALVSGALYFSTTQNVMKVYDGASWITATSAGATSLIRFRYVATSGQTTFSGADSASATLTYTVNNIVVMRNGVTLDTSEYTASNGTSIVLGVAAGTGDIVDIVAFKSFTVADALSAVSGGTVNGAVTVTGAGSIQGLTVGRGAGAVATNTAVGASALAANTSAVENTAVGYYALKDNTAITNTAFGAYAAYQNTSGTGVSAFGNGSMQSNTTGAENSAFGKSSLSTNTTGSYNTAIGRSALQSNTTASNNTAVGYQAGYSNVSGLSNVFVGESAGRSATGSSNTFIGQDAGFSVTSGANNTIIGGYNGNQGGLDIRTASNYIVLSDGDGSPAAYRVGSNGQWFFGLGGTTAGSYEGAIVLNGAATSGRGAAITGQSNGTNAWSAGSYSYVVSGTSTFFAVANTSGGVYLNGASATSWTAVSDETRKVIIEPITDAANKVSTLRAVIGRLKTDDETVRRPYLIAQDVQAVLPEAVSESEDKQGAVLGLSYTEVIPLLVAAIQELKAEVDILKAQLNGASA